MELVRYRRRQPKGSASSSSVSTSRWIFERETKNDDNNHLIKQTGKSPQIKLKIHNA